MHERDLSAVLLVKAIEETDLEGALLPAADRVAAAREAKRVGAPNENALLAERARRLLARVSARHPFVEEILAVLAGARWVSALVVFFAFASGAALSVLDGTKRINVLAFPLFGLVVWNLVIYVLVIQAWTQSGRRSEPRGQWLPAAATDFVFRRVNGLIRRSKVYNAPLADALGRFVREWGTVSRPLVVARAARVLHFSAAAMALGLIAGLYLRGIAFDYRAGWESTFLAAPMAKAVLAVMYGPASWVTGIALPDAAHLEAIRWREGGAGGEPAGPWIHLLAATALLAIVIPRLVLAGLSSLYIARRARRMALPPSVAPYARAVFAPVGGLLERGTVLVVPYAYEPARDALARLRSVVSAEMGAHLAAEVRSPVRYGDEEAFLEGLPSPPEVIVLLVSLAATPEEENHGKMIEGLRDAIARAGSGTKLVVLADEGPYATRMSAPGGSAQRLEERRGAWTSFIAARGVEAKLHNLAS